MNEEQELVLRELSTAVGHLVQEMSPSLIPEVGSNIVYALQRAQKPEDVAAVSGRIVIVKGAVHPVGPVEFGASSHIARVVLTAMRFDPTIRSAANIRYIPEIIDICEDLLLEIRSFDRSREPPGVATMDWGVAFCCQDEEGIPDIIYDTGSMGKEPMIRILAENPGRVATRVYKISERIIDTNPSRIR